jgi:hypothetical protein
MFSLGSKKPGSLGLKSSLPMEYSRGVLTNQWNQKREAEPKDNELWSGPKPNMRQSTYNSIGKHLDDQNVIKCIH